MFRTVPLSIIRVLHCTHSNGICHTGLLTACSQALLCVQCKTPDDGQRNCPKHVEFYSKNKFEELVHLSGFIKRIYHYAQSPERQTQDTLTPYILIRMPVPTYLTCDLFWSNRLLF